MAAQEPDLTNKPSGVTRPPQSKHGVPRASLQEAETLAKGLWDAARLGAVPPEALAKQLSGASAKASGGGWRAKLTLLRAFGLMANEGSQLRLSSRGKQIVQTQDEEAIQVVRRQSVLAVKVYADLLKASNGTPLPSEASLCATFEFTYGLSSADAQRAAKDFVASIRQAGFLGEGDVVRLAPEETATHDQAAVGAIDSDDDALPGGKPEKLVTTDSNGSANHMTSADMPRHGAPPYRASTQLNISLDLSQFAVDDVLRILHALGLSSDDTVTS